MHESYTAQRSIATLAMVTDCNCETRYGCRRQTGRRLGELAGVGTPTSATTSENSDEAPTSGAVGDRCSKLLGDVDYAALTSCRGSLAVQQARFQSDESHL